MRRPALEGMWVDPRSPAGLISPAGGRRVLSALVSARALAPGMEPAPTIEDAPISETPLMTEVTPMVLAMELELVAGTTILGRTISLPIAEELGVLGERTRPELVAGREDAQ